MNLVFHLAAAIGFLVLGYYLMQARKQKEILLQIVKVKKGEELQKLTVDWPLKFFKRIGQALDVEVCEDISLSEIPPKKIDVNKVIGILLGLPLTKIDLKKENSFCIHLYVSSSDGSQLKVVEELGEALGAKCQIKS